MPTVEVKVNSTSSESSDGSASTSGSTTSASLSSDDTTSTSSEVEPTKDSMRREDLVARLEEMRAELEGSRAEVMEAADELMPTAVHCQTLSDVMIAWNDALSTLLADARSACDDARMEAQTAEESDEEEPKDFRMYGDEGFMLHIDADPVDFTNLDVEYTEARTRCEAFGNECQDQLEAAVSSHDLLVECLDKELDLARKKCLSDVRSIQYGVRQLQGIAQSTLDEQQAELAEQQAMVADFRGQAPESSMTSEVSELRAIVMRLPDELPDKQLWLQQLQGRVASLQSPAPTLTDKEVMGVLQAVQRAITTLSPELWNKLLDSIQNPDTPAPEKARNMEALERNVLAMEVPADVRDDVEDIRGKLRLAIARRQQQRSEVAMGVSVATREFAHRLGELFNDYCAMHMRILDVVRDLLHTTQVKWQNALSALQTDCFGPLQELGLPFAKATMGTRCLVAYQRLTSIAQKDLDVRRKAHVETMARLAVDSAPELHDALQELRRLPTTLMTGETVYK